MVFQIASKVALITGASGGLGYHIAKELLKQGSKGVALLDTNDKKGKAVQRELRKTFGQSSCIFIKTDVSQESQIEGLQHLGAAPVYTATKQGIVAISRAYGVKEHYERSKVRVVAVCPGHMTTPMILEPHPENFNPEYMKYFNVNRDDYPIQPADFVAESISNIIVQGSNGSVWVVEDGNPSYEVEFNDRFNMRKKQA